MGEHSTLYWVLFASVIVVGVIGAIAFTIVKLKVRQMRKEYLEQLDRADALAKSKNKDGKNYETDAQKGIENVLSRKNIGEILWDFDAQLINDKIKHLAFVDMEFLINTIYRNRYTKFLQTKTVCGYELITVAKLAKIDAFYDEVIDLPSMNKYIKKYKIGEKRIQKSTNQKDFDIVFIPEFTKEIIDIVDKAYKRLKEGGMIYIAGLENRKEKKYINEIKKFLKLVGYPFEENVVCKNIMLIVKKKQK